MGKWAKEAFERLKQREGKDHERIQKEVLDRQHVLAAAPGLWVQLIDGLIEEVDDFESMRPGVLEKKDERANNTPRLIVSSSARTVTVTFNSGIPNIAYSVIQGQGPRLQPLQITKGEFTFQVIAPDVWLHHKGNSIAVPDAVQLLLEYIDSEQFRS